MPFIKIIGQDTAVRILEAMLSKQQIRGSYLFHGPDGVGKRTLALALARAINCEDRSEDECRCASCNKIGSGNHPDVFTIYPEGLSRSIKIDKIREIIYEVSLKPYEGKKRIFIINDAEAMTDEAQNSLLKILEEPPVNHVLILTSSNTAALFSTVVSRCKIVKFNRLGQKQIRDLLKQNGSGDEDSALFSHMAMGSIGRAIGLLNRDMISKRDEIVNNFFFRKSALLREGVLNECIDEDMDESLHLLLSWYRDLLVSKFTNQESEFLNIDRAQEVLSYSQRFSAKRLVDDISVIMKTIDYTRRNINPKIALFNLAVELKRS